MPRPRLYIGMEDIVPQDPCFIIWWRVRPKHRSKYLPPRDTQYNFLVHNYTICICPATVGLIDGSQMTTHVLYNVRTIHIIPNKNTLPYVSQTQHTGTPIEWIEGCPSMWILVALLHPIFNAGRSPKTQISLVPKHQTAPIYSHICTIIIHTCKWIAIRFSTHPPALYTVYRYTLVCVAFRGVHVLVFGIACTTSNILQKPNETFEAIWQTIKNRDSMSYYFIRKTWSDGQYVGVILMHIFIRHIIFIRLYSILYSIKFTSLGQHRFVVFYLYFRLVFELSDTESTNPVLGHALVHIIKQMNIHAVLCILWRWNWWYHIINC